MDADTLAALIVELLEPRDEIASATVEEPPGIAAGKVAGATVTTQGGVSYAIVVAPAPAAP